jgi:hypothetical protein
MILLQYNKTKKTCQGGIESTGYPLKGSCQEERLILFVGDADSHGA